MSGKTWCWITCNLDIAEPLSSDLVRLDEIAQLTKYFWQISCISTRRREVLILGGECFLRKAGESQPVMQKLWNHIDWLLDVDPTPSIEAIKYLNKNQKKIRNNRDLLSFLQVLLHTYQRLERRQHLLSLVGIALLSCYSYNDPHSHVRSYQS